MARLTQQYTAPVNDLDGDGGAVDGHGVSYDLEDADEDADYEDAEYEEVGDEVQYG